MSTDGPSTVAVLGGAGFIGLNIVRALNANGIRPRCVRRRTTNTIPLRKLDAELVVAELDEVASLRAALAGARVVVHAAGYYPRHSVDRERSVAYGLRQTDAVLDAAASAGVERLVYVSSTATVAARPDGAASTERDVFASEPGLGVYHDLKWHMERRVLAESRLEVAVTCPGACVGAWDLRVGTSALLVAAAHGRCPPLPAGSVGFVHAADVGRAVARLATAATPPRRTVLVGETAPVHGVLSSFAARFGASPPPAPIPRREAAAFADAEEARVLGTPERAALARELVDLIAHGPVVDASRSASELGLTFSSLGSALDDFVEWARRFRLVPPEIASDEQHESAARR